MLQWNAPLPPGFARDRERVGLEIRGALRRHGESAIARQPFVPRLVPSLERLLDQEAAKAGAVDEEIRRKLLASFERDRFDEAIGASQAHVDDLTIEPAHAPLFR